MNDEKKLCLERILGFNTIPIAKFFCLIRLKSDIESCDKKRKKRIWEQIENEMRNYND
jgi:hypothetical protein